ncbi:hypothetical protein MPSI1_001561 [Malassezia psittaci]|uniref:DUF221-domain-containing protein n=1 Tax=Malassezia psittaci TaxID=1821823 RepID=A0AAF0F5U8_9BASI|nr:hypothetical protein MPSI1_001561 [Malassezia psittaci]
MDNVRGDFVMGSNSTGPMPGPIGQQFTGPWLQQQILFSSVIGIISLIMFWLWKRRYPSLFLGRYSKQGTSLPYLTIRKTLVKWIVPVVLVSDQTVLQSVGIDGTVSLLFLKQGFVYFALLSVWSLLIVMPVNFNANGWIDGVKKTEGINFQHNQTEASILHQHKHKLPREPLPYIPFPKTIMGGAIYEYTHLVTTYVYSIVAMYVLWRAYATFIRLRQGHIRQQIESEVTRTVEVREVPEHLASHDALVAYFSELRMEVESVSILKDTRSLDRLLHRRFETLQRLEKTWTSYVGFPPNAQNYDPEKIVNETSAIETPPRPGAPPIIAPEVRVAKRARPTLRCSWSWKGPWGPRVDAIDQLSFQFAELDREAKSMRQESFKNGHTAFVTFTSATHAQIASQVVHYPYPGYVNTEPAVEPRDILWDNEEPGLWDRRVRQLIMTILMAVFLSFTLGLSATLAAIFRIDAIERYLPWLAEFLRKDVRLEAFTTFSLPTLLLVTINALVPIAMQYSTAFQRVRSKSRIDHGVLNKYFLYLIFSVVFVFAFSDARQMLKELTQNPEQMIDNLAQSLLPVARNFSLSYVIFQALATQPFQLLQLPSIMLKLFSRILYGSTPRARAYSDQAPVLSVGTLYPQALLVFTLSILYSIVSPLIVVFGAMYFAVTYVVLKYKLLNMLIVPYDSHGHAWPLAVTRCLWALLLFQVFQLSLFSVRQQVGNSVLILPLIAFTAWFLMNMRRTFAPLTFHLSLYDIYAEYDKDRQINLSASQHEHTEQPGFSSIQDDLDHENMQSRHSDPPSSEVDDHNSPEQPWSYSGMPASAPFKYIQPALADQLPTLWLPTLPTSDQDTLP